MSSLSSRPDPREIDALRAMLAAVPLPAELAAKRHLIDAHFAAYELPSDVIFVPLVAAGIAAEWALPADADPDRVVLHIHSGGFATGSIASERHLAGDLARRTGIRVIALDYRRAPEHVFPAALDDVCALYRYLLAAGWAADRIAVTGLSAGGNLAVSLAIAMRDAGHPLPACLWLGSPWSDLANTGDTMRTKAAVDPLVQKSGLDELAAAYLAGRDPRTPLASPVYGDLRGLPPILIHVGTAETLLDDSIGLCRAAAEAGVKATLTLWPDMIHVFQLWYPQLQTGRESLAAAGAFVLQETGRETGSGLRT